MNEIKTILFDAYGTVLDVGTYHRDITDYLTEQSHPLFGTTLSSDEFLLHWNEEFESAFRDVVEYCGEFKNLRDLFGISTKNVFRRYGIDLSARDVAAFSQIYKTMLDDAVMIIPSVLSTLETLCANGYRLGMVSNGDTEELLTHLGNARDFFEEIVTSEELAVYKPHARIFHEALRRMSAQRETTAFVGDMITSDVLGAQAVGLTTIWYNRRQRPAKYGIVPDFEIHDMSEVLDILQANARVAAKKDVPT
ncbi:MAG: HAD family hydrolase [Halobacteriota archaeon]